MSRQGLVPLLAGRSARVTALAAELGLPSRVFRLTDAPATRRALDGVAVVANCAGPFAATFAPMFDACVAARTHYVDIAGEIDVFITAEQRRDEAKVADIVPSHAEADAIVRRLERELTPAEVETEIARWAQAI